MTTLLQIIPELNTGGAELSTLEMTTAIVKAGARALVVTQGGRMADDITAAGGEIVSMPVATKNPLRIWKNAALLVDLINQEQVDLIHARSRAPAWSAKFAARKTGRPFVTTYHGAYGNNGVLKNRYNRIMASGDIVIANSNFTAELVRTQHGILENRLRIIHRGVDMNQYDPALIKQQDIAKLRANWQLQPGEKVVLNAARLTSWKGQHTLIEAVHTLNKRMDLSETIFILAGDAQGRTEYERSLRDKIRATNLEKRIKLVGHCADMQTAFALAHLAVVASTKPEAFGRAAVEAQSMGCPVIVTEIGATAETVLSVPHVHKEQRTGWRIPPADSQALADALEQALSLSADDRHIIGRAARTHVMQNFTLTRMQQKTLGVYDELLGTQLATTHTKM